ncbi:MAG: ribosome recycling factor [Deltaproteobacteria bacterium]|nr:ribosome recycling factor [Deltaproteobacteria bacterium]
MMNPVLDETKKGMEKALEVFQRELSRLRTGRASLAILDDVRVDYYGQPTPLSQVATLGVPESRLITISPWEHRLIPDVEKAIEKANIGLTPINDGKIIRLPIPPLNEERRRELAKSIKTHAEECRVAIRHARRESIDRLKKLEKEGSITEDENKKSSHEVQKLTDDFIARVDQASSKKDSEIMQV